MIACFWRFESGTSNIVNRRAVTQPQIPVIIVKIDDINFSIFQLRNEATLNSATLKFILEN